jgi:3-hydroxybutyryl-CoA dehydrogenase
LHFFNPVPGMPLVEIVRGLETSDATHDAAAALAAQLGKSPIIVKSAPGFVVNRILLRLVRQALRLKSGR